MDDKAIFSIHDDLLLILLISTTYFVILTHTTGQQEVKKIKCLIRYNRPEP